MYHRQNRRGPLARLIATAHAMLASLTTMSREGTPVPDVPAYRRVAAMLFGRRNDSLVYFEESVDVTDTLPWIDRWNAAGRPHLTLFLVVLHAMAKTLHEFPRLNRFVTAGALYQREGVWLSFTAKRSMEPAAPLVVIKRRFEPGESLEAFARAMDDRIRTARREGDRHGDREMELLLKIPHPVLRRVLALAPALDAWGLLPSSFRLQDPFFASVFLTNMGSLGADAIYHHLYEYGNIPLFCSLGHAREEVVARGGQPVVRTIARLRITFDERIEDGFNAVRALRHLREAIERPMSVSASE